MERVSKEIADTSPNRLAIKELRTMVSLNNRVPRSAFNPCIIVMADFNRKSKVQIWKDRENGI